jgi:DivIVA domain-containing protein
MASDQRREPTVSASGARPGSQTRDEAAGERRDLEEVVEDVSFPVSVRGYDRAAVDAYVSRVRQAVAEFELRRSPEEAVKRALETVGEQTKGLLEQAGLTAEEVTTAARHDAEETTASARREADEVVAKANSEAEDIRAHSQAEAEAMLAHTRTQAAEELQRCHEEVNALRSEAEARLHELRADRDAIREERGRLLADIREITTRVEEVASAADVRFPPAEVAEKTADVTIQSEAADEAAKSEVTTRD